MSVNLLLFLALLPHFVFSYNVDIASPIVYKDPDVGQFNYFGYSVSLSRGKYATSPFTLYVGAPNATHGHGIAYRCTESARCQPLKILDKQGPTPGWLGASMAAGESPSEFTVCAPHSLVRQYYSRFRNLLRGGTCYQVSEYKGGALHIDDGYTFQRTWYSVLTGFSVDYARTRGAASNKDTSRIIGRPGVQYVDVQVPGHRGNEELILKGGRTAIGFNYFGYSVSSGHYRDRTKLRFAAGGPSWRRKGMFAIFEQGALNHGEEKFAGSVLGEYFGASLATGDFDGDGFDDIAVGAPHWGNVDFGRVYTFYGGANSITRGRTLPGKVEKGQFGYTLASADLDRDSYSDLIVSAPWEDSGVVYIFYGRRDFRVENPSAQTIQRIEPSTFGLNDRIQRFGFSLSRPVDIDSNGYPDLAIGAYKSGRAFILRSRPVIRTTIQLESNPTMLKTNNTDFTVSVCVTYNGTAAPEYQNLSFDMMVDARYKRASNGAMQRLNGTFRRGQLGCIDKNISLTTREDRNIIDPIMIDVTHSIQEGMDQGKIYPVLNRQSSGSKVSLTVPINTNCKNFTACNAELEVSATFENLGKDNVWVVGSGDVRLNILARNKDEPAYDARITIQMPALGIGFHSPVKFCEFASDRLSLACDVGNPLVKERPITFDIDLDMSNIDTRSAGALVPYLTFNVTKSTRSIDKAATTPIPPLQLNIKHDADINLSGMASKKQIDYRRIAKDTKIPVQHFYQVRKFGLSPITEAYLNVDVPTSMIGKNVPFLNISHPTLTDNYGTVQNCYINEARSVNHTGERKRRGDSGGDDETFVTSGSTATDGIPKPDNKLSNNGDDEEKTIARSMAGRTIYLNCSTKGVLCTRFTCGFVFPESHEAVKNFVLDMTFNATSFHASDEESVNIKIRTDASVDVRRPLISDSTEMRNWTASAMTMLYSIREPTKLAGWIIPVSIIFGILLFCLAAFIMYKVGFFNRSKKLETAKAVAKELVINANDADDANDGKCTDPALDGNGNDEDDSQLCTDFA